jgi:hypothetical protein
VYFQVAAVLVILLLQTPALLAGQAAALPAAWGPQLSPNALMPSSSTRSEALYSLAARGASPKPTNWREGGLVGAAVFGLALASLGGGLCSYGEGRDCTGATVLGAVAGGGMAFVIGALVGGLFPKGP